MSESAAAPASTFKWTDRYSVNIKGLDTQHRGLFEIINRLNQALSAGHGAEAMNDVLQKLVLYTQSHFSAEEALMQKHGFPGFEVHRAEHESFIRAVEKHVTEFKEGKAGAPVSLLFFLQAWLKHHILKTDKAYSSFLNANGVS